MWADTLQSLVKGKELQRPMDMTKQVSHQNWFWYMDSNHSLLHPEGDSWSITAPISAPNHRLRTSHYCYRHSQVQNCVAPTISITPASVELVSSDVLQAMRSDTLVPDEVSQSTAATQNLSQNLTIALCRHPYYSYLNGDFSPTQHQLDKLREALNKLHCLLAEMALMTQW